MKFFKFILYIAMPILLLLCSIATWYFYSHRINGYMLGIRAIGIGVIGYGVMAIIAFKALIESKKC